MPSSSDEFISHVSNPPNLVYEKPLKLESYKLMVDYSLRLCSGFFITKLSFIVFDGKGIQRLYFPYRITVQAIGNISSFCKKN